MSAGGLKGSFGMAFSGVIYQGAFHQAVSPVSRGQRPFGLRNLLYKCYALVTGSTNPFISSCSKAIKGAMVDAFGFVLLKCRLPIEFSSLDVYAILSNSHP